MTFASENNSIKKIIDKVKETRTEFYSKVFELDHELINFGLSKSEEQKLISCSITSPITYEELYYTYLLKHEFAIKSMFKQLHYPKEIILGSTTTMVNMISTFDNPNKATSPDCKSILFKACKTIDNLNFLDSQIHFARSYYGYTDVFDADLESFVKSLEENYQTLSTQCLEWAKLGVQEEI